MGFKASGTGCDAGESMMGGGGGFNVCLCGLANMFTNVDCKLFFSVGL